MWIVIAYKPNELNILKNSIRSILKKDFNYYIPKIKYKKMATNGIKEVQKNILQSYLICQNDRFKDQSFLNVLCYAKGVRYILNNSQFNKGTEKNENLIKKSIEDNDYLTTETLAEMYVEQGHYERAIQAYHILCLKYPKKSSFFADRIEQIKNKIL